MSEPKRLSRQERAFQWRRDHVLESAERVFARKGFHEATMQQIAQEAEYATGTLYGFFVSKEALFAAVIERRIPQINEQLLGRAERGQSAREKIERFVQAFFEFFDSHRDLFQIYVNVTGGFPWTVRAELGEQAFQSHLASADFLEGVFRDGIRKGEFRQDLDPRLAAVSVGGILTAVATDWVTRLPDKPFSTLRHGTCLLLSAVLSPNTQP